MISSLLGRNLVLSIWAEMPLNVNSAEREKRQKGCEQNLKAIGKALAAYRADHDGDMPDWLSDLYPEYLSDPELMLCPADKERGNPVFKALTDPTMPCSYLYEFSPVKYTFTAWVFDRHPQAEYTYKELRPAQLPYFGNIIPVVRCWHHRQGSVDNRSLDLRYDGKVDILTLDWETVSDIAFQAAFAFFQRAIERNPNSLESEFSFQKIAAYFRICKRIPEFQSLLEHIPNLSTSVLRRLVEVYESEGKISAAIERCEQLLRQTPDDIQMRVILAKLYLSSKDYRAAQREIDRVLRLAPQDAQAHRLHIELLAIDNATRVQNMLADTPQADDVVSLQTRYSVKFQERLFSSEKTLSSAITKARLALQESFADEQQVNQLDYLYEAAEKSLSKNAEDWKTYSTSDGLTSDYVHGIVQDSRGVLWFGTGKGVCQYDGSTFVSIPQLDGQLVMTMLEDRYGSLWFGTASGVIKMNGNMLTSITTEDGLRSNYVRALHEDDDGHIWIGTKEGLTKYTPNSVLPPIHIQSMVADGVEAESEAVEPYRAPRNLQINYLAISFITRPETMQYTYQLEGDDLDTGQPIESVDSQWQSPTNKRTANYLNLRPGSYTFRVKAIDRDFNVSDPAEVTFTVEAAPHLRLLRETREELELAYRKLQAKNVELQATKEEAEKARELAEIANQAKSRFLANMSHEIRTPLSVILGYAQILQREFELQSEVQNGIETIENSGVHLLHLINNVLDISKIEAGKMTSQAIDFDLVDFIERLSVMFEIRCERKQLTWQVQWTWEDARRRTRGLLVNGDEGKLRQLLINLVDNAIKFTESGKVILRVGREETPLTNTSIPSHLYRFEVIDTGVGIPPEVQERIFEPFQQEKAAGIRTGGVGLGLAIAKKQIELMNGKLDFESEPGVGSRFFFTVPLPPASVNSSPSSAHWRDVTRLADGFGVRALVADDSKDNRELLVKMLASIGCHVWMAEDGKQAVAMVETYQPDIVFMDIRMPILDGEAATRQILQAEGNTPLKIVAISASALLHQRQRYFDAGFHDFVAKPFRFERICECLANLLNVRYEYTSTTTSSGSEQQPICLPSELIERLRNAAKFLNLTELDRYLDEVSNLESGGQQLAADLRSKVQSYDVEGILNTLTEIEQTARDKGETP